MSGGAVANPVLRGCDFTTDACIAQLQQGEKAGLAMNGRSCGSSRLSLGDTGAGAAAEGDQLIDNFYKRGRSVKVARYAGLAASGTPVVIVKRVDGVAPKVAALESFPWMEMDAATKSALAAYDGAASSLTAGWAANRGGHVDIVNGHTSQVIPLDHRPAQRPTRWSASMAAPATSLAYRPTTSAAAACRTATEPGKTGGQGSGGDAGSRRF